MLKYKDFKKNKIKKFWKTLNYFLPVLKILLIKIKKKNNKKKLKSTKSFSMSYSKKYSNTKNNIDSCKIYFSFCLICIH